MISWETAFNPGDQVWMVLASLLVILLGPTGFILILWPERSPGKIDSLLLNTPILLSTLILAWCLWGYSLAYAPSWGYVPEIPSMAPEPSSTLQEAMAIADARVDETSNIGRGGFIGGLEYFAMSNVAPVLGQDGPLFPRRRPHTHLPHVVECLFRLSGLCLAMSALWVAGSSCFPLSGQVLITLLWSTAVYAPIAHWINGDGWLELMGAVDFGGGLIFIAVGCSGLVSQLRGSEFRGDAQPENVRVPVIGALVLWIAMSLLVSAHTFHADERIGLVLLNFLLGTSTTIAIWGITNSFVWKQCSATLLPVGSLAGFSAMASTAGYVQPQSAIIIGAIVGLTANVVIQVRRNEGTQEPSMFMVAMTVGGVLGMLSTGLFATRTTAGSRWDGRPIEGVLDGHFAIMGHQLVAVGATIAWAFVMSWLINRLTAMCVRRFGSN